MPVTPWCKDIQRKHPTHIFHNGYKEMLALHSSDACMSSVPKLSTLPAPLWRNWAACYTRYYVSCIANSDI